MRKPGHLWCQSLVTKKVTSLLNWAQSIEEFVSWEYISESTKVCHCYGSDSTYQYQTEAEAHEHTQHSCPVLLQSYCKQAITPSPESGTKLDRLQHDIMVNACVHRVSSSASEPSVAFHWLVSVFPAFESLLVTLSIEESSHTAGILPHCRHSMQFDCCC